MNFLWYNKGMRERFPGPVSKPERSEDEQYEFFEEEELADPDKMQMKRVWEEIKEADVRMAKEKREKREKKKRKTA